MCCEITLDKPWSVDRLLLFFRSLAERTPSRAGHPMAVTSLTTIAVLIRFATIAGSLWDDLTCLQAASARLERVARAGGDNALATGGNLLLSADS